MKNRHDLLLLALFALGGPFGCDPKGDNPTPANAPGDRLIVAVAIQPQTYFVRRIGGDLVDVHAVLSPGQSHGAFDPSAQQVAKLLKARAFFRIGVAFEATLTTKLRELSPTTEVVDTRTGIQLLSLAEHHHDNEPGGQEHPDDEKGHVCGDSELDPHVWLDPELVRVQAKTICETLKRLDPTHADQYDRNLASFDAELVAMDAKLQAMFKPHKGRTILVFHPSFAYFCNRYGLKQIVIETEGKEPGPRRLSELIGLAKTSNAKVVFSQIEYSAGGANAIAEAIGGSVVRVAPQSADWADNLISMADAMVDSFRK